MYLNLGTVQNRAILANHPTVYDEIVSSMSAEAKKAGLKRCALHILSHHSWGVDSSFPVLLAIIESTYRKDAYNHFKKERFYKVKF